MVGTHSRWVGPEAGIPLGGREARREAQPRPSSRPRLLAYHPSSGHHPSVEAPPLEQAALPGSASSLPTGNQVRKESLSGNEFLFFRFKPAFLGTTLPCPEGPGRVVVVGSAADVTSRPRSCWREPGLALRPSGVAPRSRRYQIPTEPSELWRVDGQLPG